MKKRILCQYCGKNINKKDRKEMTYIHGEYAHNECFNSHSAEAERAEWEHWYRTSGVTDYYEGMDDAEIDDEYERYRNP